MQAPASPFAFKVRIYWEDTDAGGIVYYANYLKFMERARTEWLRSIGIEQLPLQRERGLMFVVVEADTQFRKPARYGDLLQVSCAVARSGRASVTFKQDIVRDDASRELLVTGQVRVACLDAVRLRPQPLPEILMRELSVAGED